MQLIKPKKVPEDGIIVDVLSDKSFAREHIKGAKNFCVYELAFAEKIKAAFSTNETLYIYGYSKTTQESAKAYSILKELGYEQVFVIDGGLLEWKKQGLETDSLATEKLDGDYLVSQDSRIEWTGRNIGNKHTGKIALKEGRVRFRQGTLTKGELTIDMDTITNDDLSGKPNQMLVGHLKSADFFEVKKFPYAKIEFQKVKILEDVESKPNYQIEAELTLKGITQKITFAAQVQEKEGLPVLNAHLDIDRSRWDVTYGSEKFFAKLGMHIIDDFISLDVILLFKK